jgi:hypothetical protein
LAVFALGAEDRDKGRGRGEKTTGREVKRGEEIRMKRDNESDESER